MSNMCLAKVSSHFGDCLTAIDFVLGAEEVLVLRLSNFSVFVFLACIISVIPRNPLPNPVSGRYSPVFLRVLEFHTHNLFRMLAE